MVQNSAHRHCTEHCAQALQLLSWLLSGRQLDSIIYCTSKEVGLVSQMGNVSSWALVFGQLVLSGWHQLGRLCEPIGNRALPDVPDSFISTPTQARVTGEEGPSAEKMPPSDWAVGKPVRHFLN